MTILPPGRRSRRAFVWILFASVVVGLAAQSAFATSPDLVISQVYGGGGNTGAPYTNDFIEIFNRGTVTVSLSGKTVQYTSAASTGLFSANVTTLPAVTLAPGQYFLVQESGGANGVPLPAPDATGGILVSATAGKVVLVNGGGLACNGGSTPCNSTQLAQIIDLVGYGSTANFFEGPAPAPTLSNTLAAFRAPAGQGCTDTDNNAADFATATPTPRNRTSPLAPCAGPTNPSGSGAATPSLLLPGDATLLTVAVTPGGNPTSTGLAVNADLTAIGGAVAQAFFDDGTNGDATAGDNTFSFATAVALGTSVGAKSLPVTITDLQGRGGSGNIALTVILATLIRDLQLGVVPPATVVTTSGIVTGVKSSSTSGGFFIETSQADPEWDATIDGFQGIFVFTGSAPVPAGVAPGNRVNVIGTLQEYIPGPDPSSPSMTELANPSVTLLSVGNALPAAVPITVADANATSTIDTLEKYEGMRVHVDSLTVISPTGGRITESSATSATDGVFHGVLPGVARPFREPGIQAPTPLPNPPCCIPQWDNNPERIRVATSALVGATALEVTTGATVTNITGPLDYAYRTYTIDVEPGASPGVSGNVTFTAVPTPTISEFTIGCQNLQHFFDDVADGNGAVTLTTPAYNNRLNKASLLIRNVLFAPDILGVEEAETLTGLQNLADKVNADAIAASQPNPNYVAYLLPGNDIGGINVGVLANATRVTVNSVTQALGSLTATYTDPTTGNQALIWDRPPLVVDATIVGPPAMPIVVIVNHLRSLGGIDDPTEGSRVRAKRRAGAEWLANYVQARQVANPAERIVLVGDFNAYEVNDGYVDVMGTIKGTPTPSDNVVLASSDLVNPDLTDLIDMVPPAEKYSYSYDGSAQTLDHILMNANLSGYFSAMAYGRADADFPESYRNDATRPERLSDHDGGVAYFASTPVRARLQLDTLSSVPQASGFTVTVTAVDASNNTLTTYNGTVHFTSSDPLAGLPVDYTFTAPDAGVHTFSNQFVLGTAGAQSITATDTLDPLVTASASVTVTCNSSAPGVSNGGPYTVGQTIHLFAPPVAGATFSWTGPSSFTSTLQNPTIANAQLANAGTYSVTITAAGCVWPPGTTDVVVNAVQPPTNVVATTVTPTGVDVTWTAAAGAAGYDVLRKEPGGVFVVIGSSLTTGYTDNTAVANNAYLYAVRSVDASANPSANSAADLATTFVFTDDPVVGGTTAVRAVHFEELRGAINTLRALAGLGAAAFTDSSLADVAIKGTHIDEMRTALDAARAALLLPTLSYTDPTITGGTTFIKAVHTTELRAGVR